MDANEGSLLILFNQAAERLRNSPDGTLRIEAILEPIRISLEELSESEGRRFLVSLYLAIDFALAMKKGVGNLLLRFIRATVGCGSLLGETFHFSATFEPINYALKDFSDIEGESLLRSLKRLIAEALVGKFFIE